MIRGILLTLAVLSGKGLANIHIWEPKQLKSMYQGKDIPYTIMNFGEVPYGHTIYGTVFIAEPFNGCTEINPLKWEKNFGTLILMVERGGCNFSEKVINAQKVGAGFVIIADNNQDDVHRIFPVERSKELLSRVKIASILIGKTEASNIKNAVAMQQEKIGASSPPVELAIHFALVKSSSKVSLKFILQVDDYRSYDLVLAYMPLVGNLAKYISLHLHFKVFQNSEQFFSPNDCVTSDKKSYCVASSFGNSKENLNLIGETMRQMCLWQEDKAAFVKYIALVRQKCFDGEGSLLDSFKECTKGVFEDKVSKSTQKTVQACENIGSTENSKALQKNHDEIKYLLINYSPLIFINGAYFKGNYENANHILESVCNAFDSPPGECQKFEAFQSTLDMNSSAFWKFVMKALIICSILVFLFIIVAYLGMKRRLKQNFDFTLNDKINEALAKYYGEDEAQRDGSEPSVKRSEESSGQEDGN